MNSFDTILAQITMEPKEMGSYWHNSNISRAGLGAVFSAICVVTVIILVWAIFIRKPRDDRPRRYQYPALPEKEGAKNEQMGSSGRPFRRKKRRRRAHRQRKPTLAETGGLPPVRNDDFPSDDPP